MTNRTHDCRAETCPGHKHAPYSHDGRRFRCRCGAVSSRGDGPWQDDGTRGCAICAQPASTTEDPPLCKWHRLMESAQ